jgi:hypothetical protein
MSMPKKEERVIVYGLPADTQGHNQRIGSVKAKDFKTFQVTVAFDDGTTVTVGAQYCFFTSLGHEYFNKPRDSDEQLWSDDYIRVAIDEQRNKRVLATKRIPAGALLAFSTQRVTMTKEEIGRVETEYMKFVFDNLYALMGRKPNEPKIKFEPNYSRALVFVGAVAARGTYGHPVMQTVLSYDPSTPERLRDLWRRCDGQDLLWLEFWRRKLENTHKPEQVFHIWHMVVNFAWPSLDRLSLVFGETICFTECHPLRVAEYEKVMAGTQNADEDKYANEYLSAFMMTPPGCGDGVTAYFLKDVEAGETLYTDFGLTYVSDLCDTVLNFLFMDDGEDGNQFLYLYKNITRHYGEAVMKSFQGYLQTNLPRAILTRNVNRTQATGVRTTPAVHALRASAPTPALPTGMPPTYALPTCYYCAKPMEHAKLCALCKIAAYCDKACQTADWKAGHKANCMPR